MIAKSLSIALVFSCCGVALAQKEAADFQWVNPLPKNAPDSVKHGTFECQATGGSVGYCILLPPDYTDPANAETRYPVVYWLHGGRPGSETKNIRLAPKIFALMESGRVPGMIYVFPNGGRLSHYDHEDSPGETAFLELVRHVDRTYRTIADHKGRAIEGFSQGGRGAGRYLLKHPELFCSAAPMGGGHQHEKFISENEGSEYGRFKLADPRNNTYDLARDYSSRKHPPLRILIVVGQEDMNHGANLDWHQHLLDQNIRHKFKTLPGVGHSAMDVYDKIGEEIMNFHAESFRQLGGIE
ncbi:MAG: prolyl oligopeptidase family serine peptidase [Planctomycetaceae bacterium]|nr:prolyl oligopeptidase family serine peptidase [Planctomycetaceae bacterium]